MSATNGGSDQTVGLVIGVFSFIALASRLISGPLADRRGTKNRISRGLIQLRRFRGSLLAADGNWGSLPGPDSPGAG